jgi:hypothetical protein
MSRCGIRWSCCGVGCVDGSVSQPRWARAMIRRMSVENLLWGAPRIHGELLKLGFEVAQSTVPRYMVRRWRSPSQGWRTFLRNHAPEIAAMDVFVVPTVGFKLL